MKFDQIKEIAKLHYIVPGEMIVSNKSECLKSEGEKNTVRKITFNNQ